MIKWYCAVTKPGRAQWAHDNLKAQGFEIFLPVMLGGILLFPGYIFVAFDKQQNPYGWQPINGTRGVHHLLPNYREEPSALPDDFVRDLKSSLAAMRPPEDPKPVQFALGDAIAVTSGPFAGHKFTVKVLRRNVLYVDVKLFNQEVLAAVLSHQAVLIARAVPSTPGTPCEQSRGAVAS